MKRIIKYLTIIIAGIILVKCANQQSPPGGPKDTEPPEIVGVYPENGTLNFADDYFEIDFSEYVEKLSLLDALFISPEIQNLDYDWSGTSVQITFDDTLLVNTTYTVSIGSSIKDLNNQNPMTEAMNISFSTGEKIDVGEITGKVYDNDLTGTMIFAYLKADTFANPLFEKPQNITQVGENGEFKLLGLKEGEYRIFAFMDENGNRLYNMGDEKYGVSSKTINISDSANSINGINFKLTREDTIAPFISSVTMTDKHHISVEYSELLDSTKLNASNFYIVDTASNRNIDIKHLYQGNRKKFEYFLSIADTLDIEANNILIADSIYDKHSNLATYDSYEFVVNEKPDTLLPEIKSISSTFGKNKIDFLKPIFTINFNDGIDAKQLKTALILDKYNWELTKRDDASFIVKILEILEANENIEFSINRKMLSDAAGNSHDSVQVFTNKTLTGREFSGLSGKINSSDSTSNVIVVINNTKDALLNYTTKVTHENAYKFERVLPGLNIIWMFQDIDKNENYNFGKISPFELSEEFFVHPDTVNLRPRWPVGDVNLNIN
jgi:hypothetical protein